MDKELVEFLEQRFEKSERRTEELIQEVRTEIQEVRTENRQLIQEVRTENRQLIQEVRTENRAENRQTRVLIEDLRGQIQLVAEGVVNQGERLDRFQAEVAEEFRETKALVRLSYSALEHRMKGLESRVDDLDGRLTALENAA